MIDRFVYNWIDLNLKVMNLLDIIIIGGGVSGAASAMYAARFNMKTLVFAEQPGGLITTTHLVENYPGIKSISGPQMGMDFLQHALDTGAEFKYEKVTAIEESQVELNGKMVKAFNVTSSSGVYTALTIVIATGTKHKHLHIEGEEKYKNKGVSYCALCDAAFFKDKDVLVVGGGDTAAIDANILSKQCKSVKVLVRKDFMRAEPTNFDRIQKDPKVEILFETEVQEVLGDGENMTGVLLKDGSQLKADGLFVAIGWDTQSELAEKLGVELNGRKEIVINREAMTNLEGVYAAGDVTNARFKQAIVGAAEGVYASVEAFNYLEKLKNS